ncbi:hypothetical protein [Stygiolobus caldivivus]|nr:hypothetical protein [Stygiolobus caldivivus]
MPDPINSPPTILIENKFNDPFIPLEYFLQKPIDQVIQLLKQRRPIKCVCGRKYYLIQIPKDRVEDYITTLDFTDNVITEAKRYKILTSERKFKSIIKNNITGVTIPVNFKPDDEEIPDEIKNNKLKLAKIKSISIIKKPKGVFTHIIFKNPEDKKIYFLTCIRVLNPNFTEERICFKLTPVVVSKKEGGKYG